MASEALVGNIPKDVTLEDIAKAEEIINSAFDGCRYLVGFYPCEKTCENLGEECTVNKPAQSITSMALSSKTEILKATVYPNPYRDEVKFTIEFKLPGNARLDLYNLLGQRVETVFQGYLSATGNKVIVFKMPKQKNNFIYILKVGDKQVTGKLIRSN